MASYAAPKLSKEKTSAVEQGFFDFLVPYRSPLITPVQAAKSLSRGTDFVYTLLHDGQLEYHGVPGREISRYTITKRSLVLYLAGSANYKPEDLTSRLAEIAATLTDEQYAAFLAQARERRARI